MENVFRVLALILIAQSLAALAGALRFARYALSSGLHRRHRYQPKAVVIVPCKGLEDGLEENIRALCTQDYREYELIFVTESEMDAAYPLLSKVRLMCLSFLHPELPSPLMFAFFPLRSEATTRSLSSKSRVMTKSTASFLEV